MSFASMLDGYCKTVECTNKELADLCGISPSTLSRYRKGSRTPDCKSDIIGKLAFGIARFSNEKDALPLHEDAIRSALEASITEANMVGMDFNMRLDTLMHLIGIRNVKMAEATQVDPSYISRIRQGRRMPSNLKAFTEPASRLSARLCMDKGLVKDVADLIGPFDVHSASQGEIDTESSLAEVIGEWLLGNEIVESDVAAMEKLFAWLDKTDLSPWIAMGDEALEKKAEPVMRLSHSARFYYGTDGMRNAEIDFLTTAYETHSRQLSLSSDMPLLHMNLDHAFIVKYRRCIENLLRDGCHVNIVHSVEQPLEESIRTLRMWIPYYLTGHATPYYLKGIHNRLFFHVNYVCDTCALASEAMSGHQEDGRYFFTARPADIAYYQKKMGFILERSSSLLEIYRDDIPSQRRAFEHAEANRHMAGHVVGEGRYNNLQVVSHTSECTVLSFACGKTTVHLVISHPKINYAVARMK